jgi:putative SOS response-associated peptidase YedK
VGGRAKPDIGQVLRFYEYTSALLWQIYSSCVFTQIHFRQYTATGKQPWYFTRADGEPMTFAGLWDKWKDKATGEVLKSCTMLVTEPNDFVAEVHDRAREGLAAHGS